MTQTQNHTAPTAPRIGLVYQRPRKVAFVRAHGTYAVAAQRAWHVLLGWLDERALTPNLPCGYGLAHDNPRRTAHEQCRFDACVELPRHHVEHLTDGVSFQMLPGGAYARVRHVGPYSTLKLSVGRVRDEWLAEQTNLTFDRRRPLQFTYLDDPRSCDEPELRTDVCMPVRAPCDDVFARTKFDDPAKG